MMRTRAALYRKPIRVSAFPIRTMIDNPVMVGFVADFWAAKRVRCFGDISKRHWVSVVATLVKALPKASIFSGVVRSITIGMIFSVG